MHNILQELKEQLFDAPVEVKEAFNSIVSYFDVEYTYKDLYEAIKFIFPNYSIREIYGEGKDLYILTNHSRSSYRLPYQIDEVLKRAGLPSKGIHIAGSMAIPETAIKLK